MVESIPSVLQKIGVKKSLWVKENKKRIPQPLLEEQCGEQQPTRGFAKALQAKILDNKLAVIAEAKKASPSKGIIRQNFDVEAIAKAYESVGAACLSVLTDVEFFKGADEYLSLAKATCALPVLRKDFIIDPYQIYESRILGADCILLIAAMLSTEELLSMESLAIDLGMDVLVEVHSLQELEKVKAMQSTLVGINNRNLHDFSVDLQTSLQLKAHVNEEKILISESGIHTQQDVALLSASGIKSFLVGEAFMREPHPAEAFRSLFPG